MADAYDMPALEVPRRAPPQFARSTPTGVPERRVADARCDVADEIAALPGFANGHPALPSERLRPALESIHRLEELLCRLTGLDECASAPAAGLPSHTAALLMIRRFHELHNSSRGLVLVPAEELALRAPACAMAGYEAIPLKRGASGLLECDAVDEAIRRHGREIACLFFSNPGARGLFESHIVDISELLHGIGAQLLLDGARLDRTLGVASPREMGIDVLSWNLSDAFTGHRPGDGPDAGPLLARAHLARFLPGPRVRREGGRYFLDESPQTVGRVGEGFGNLAAQLRALVFILHHGGEDLKRLSRARRQSPEKQIGETFVHERTQTDVAKMVEQSGHFVMGNGD